MTRPLRVGIDAHMVGGQETGNETYVKGLVDGLMKIAPDALDCVIFNIASPWTPANGRMHFQKLATGNPLVRLGLELPIRSALDHIDVLHMTYSSPLWTPSRVVLTVHDICYATHPEWFSARDVRVLSVMVPRSIAHAAHVITVSHQARKEIIERYGVPEAKISAIPNGPGLNAPSSTDDEARAQVAASGIDPGLPYVLSVGNLQPRKNIGRLIEAFRRLPAELHLVIVGPKHYRAEDVIAAGGADSGRIHFTGYVSDRELASIYQCSVAFIMPSLYEGFGLPVLEAMSRGIPVASSNAGALPEVCGDAAVMFDPLDVDAMTDAINRVVGDQDLRRRLAEAGKARAAAFSWEKTATLTLQVYERARR